MLTPLNKKLVVQLIEKETVTAGGIILTRADPHEANRGKVVSIGPEVLDISVGDVILPNWNKAPKTKVGDETFYIVTEEDVVLVFEE